MVDFIFSIHANSFLCVCFLNIFLLNLLGLRWLIKLLGFKYTIL